MLGDITPPRSFLNPGSSSMASGGGGGGGEGNGLQPGNFGGSGLMSTGGDASGFGGLGGNASGLDGAAAQGRRGEVRTPPGVLSVIVGLPFRLLGKVRLAVGVVWYSCGTVRHGMVRCGTVRCGAVRCGAVRYGTVAVRHGMVRHGAFAVRYGKERWIVLWVGNMRCSDEEHAWCAGIISDLGDATRVSKVWTHVLECARA